MSNQQDVIVGKVVPFTEAEMAQATQTTLSEKVVQIIATSGVNSLQILVGTEGAGAVAAAVRRYWNLR